MKVDKLFGNIDWVLVGKDDRFIEKFIEYTLDEISKSETVNENKEMPFHVMPSIRITKEEQLSDWPIG